MQNFLGSQYGRIECLRGKVYFGDLIVRLWLGQIETMICTILQQLANTIINTPSIYSFLQTL